jgi:phage terminase large subunit
MSGDCNPDAPYHWLKQREKDGRLLMLDTEHRDNPVYWDAVKNDWTDKGRAYVLGKLEKLTGVRLQRLRWGKWVGAEGIVYPEFNREVHIIPRFATPDNWERIWVIDFGYRDPFVWQEWAIADNGDMYMTREIYMTGRTVKDHIEMILSITKAKQYPSQRPSAIICDHDAEDRATVEQVLAENRMPMLTLPAYKRIAPGIAGMKGRLSRNKLFFMEDSIYEVDPILSENKHPTSTTEEVESYVWDEKKRHGLIVPKDEYNHGMDAARYAVAFVDDLAIDPQDQEDSVVLDDDERVVISPY